MICQGSNHQIKYGAIISYFTIGFYIVAGLLYTPYLISRLGLSDYGIFTISLSVISYFSIDFGIGAAQTRFIARYRAEGDEQKIYDLLGITCKLYLAIDLLIMVALCCLYFFSKNIFVSLSSEELERFQVVLLITSCYIALSFPMLPLNGIFLAYERIIAMQSFELFAKVFSIGALVTALYMGYGLYVIVFINALIIWVTQFLKLIYLQRCTHLHCNLHSRDKTILKSLASFSIWTTVATIADKFFFPLIPFLLAAFSNTTEIALFAIVITVEGYILTIARAMNGLFLPKVTKMVVGQAKGEEKTMLMIKVGRLQLYIIGMIITGLIVFGRDFFHLWLGDGFDKSYYAMLIIIFPCLFHLTTGIAEELIYATNNVKYRSLIYVSCSIISTLTIVVLAPRWGAIGAAVGVCAGFVFAYNILAYSIYYKVLHLNIKLFLLKCHASILPILLLVGLMGYMVQTYLPTSGSMVYLGVKVSLWGLMGFLSLWFLSMNSGEKDILRSLICRR